MADTDLENVETDDWLEYARSREALIPLGIFVLVERADGSIRYAKRQTYLGQVHWLHVPENKLYDETTPIILRWKLANWPAKTDQEVAAFQEGLRAHLPHPPLYSHWEYKEDKQVYSLFHIDSAIAEFKSQDGRTVALSSSRFRELMSPLENYERQNPAV